MGPDMYLTKKVDVKNWDHLLDSRRWDINAKRGGEPVEFGLPVQEIVLEAADWRKANAIHKWFVDHCQNGRDECQVSYVDREQLEELLALCRQVLETIQTGKGDATTLQSLLPTQSGFFFGPTTYDQFCLDDLRLTIEQLTKALADPIEGDFYYEASW